MKTIIFSLILICSTQAHGQSMNNDTSSGLSFMSQSDKQLHALGSYALNYTAYTYFRSKEISKTRSLIYSSLLTLAVGAIKEGTDSHWDPKDMGANALGTGLSMTSIIVIDF